MGEWCPGAVLELPHGSEWKWGAFQVSPPCCFASGALLQGAVALTAPGWAGCPHALGTAGGPVQRCCMAVITLVTLSPCMGHYPGCILLSKPCKLLTGHGKARWPSTGTNLGNRGELGGGDCTGAVQDTCWCAILGSELGDCTGVVQGTCWCATLGSELGGCTGAVQGPC